MLAGHRPQGPASLCLPSVSSSPDILDGMGGTQGLVLAKQALYLQSHLLNPGLLGFYQNQLTGGGGSHRLYSTKMLWLLMQQQQDGEKKS